MGYNVIPHAALCQHRYSLQLNGETKQKENIGGTQKVFEKTSPRLTHRKFSAPKTPERQRKSFTSSFGTPQGPRRFSESDDEMASFYTPRGIFLFFAYLKKN